MRAFTTNDVWFLLNAATWTLALSAIAFAGGSVCGTAAALMRLAAGRATRAAGTLYVQLFQGTPLLVQLFIWYFGVSLMGGNLPPLFAAGLALSLYSGAFFAEIVRGSLLAVPKGQREAAASLGLHWGQQLLLVVAPQALRIALPPTAGLMVQIIKNTSLAALVGFVELARAGQLINNATFEPVPAFLCVGAIYFAICFPISRLSRWLERRLHVERRVPDPAQALQA